MASDCRVPGGVISTMPPEEFDPLVLEQPGLDYLFELDPPDEPEPLWGQTAEIDH